VSLFFASFLFRNVLGNDTDGRTVDSFAIVEPIKVHASKNTKSKDTTPPYAHLSSVRYALPDPEGRPRHRGPHLELPPQWATNGARQRPASERKHPASERDRGQRGIHDLRSHPRERDRLATQSEGCVRWTQPGVVL